MQILAKTLIQMEKTPRVWLLQLQNYLQVSIMKLAFPVGGHERVVSLGYTAPRLNFMLLKLSISLSVHYEE